MSEERLNGTIGLNCHSTVRSIVTQVGVDRETQRSRLSSARSDTFSTQVRSRFDLERQTDRRSNGFVDGANAETPPAIFPGAVILSSVGGVVRVRRARS